VAISSLKTTRYTHQEIGKDVIFGIAGFYTPQQEVRLKYRGREVLYIIGQVVLESSCCGAGNESACCSMDNWTYAIVPGYIVNWQSTKNEDGLPVSEIEPVTDGKERKELTEIIQAKEGILPIEFW
jgi:hypothetical protein